jgi:trans-aconitate methyltransferase
MTSAEPLQGGFDRDAFAPLADAEAGSFWFRSRNELILWAIRHYAPDVDDLVEVGCGTGFVLRAITDAFPRARVTGIEPFEEGLAIARTRVPTAEFRCGDVEALRDVAAFDVAGAFDVLEHIPDDDRAIALVAGALRPGGVFVVTVPQHPRLWSTSDVEAHHVRRYVRSALVGQLRVAGFETVLATSFVSLLAPAMLAR